MDSCCVLQLKLLGTVFVTPNSNVDCPGIFDGLYEARLLNKFDKVEIELPVGNDFFNTPLAAVVALIEFGVFISDLKPKMDLY
ncbi:hypothetical protein DERP_005809 [Dermatophagoides pteronyssinus]|uniref:Uncharacterized protein n=1 Tax=Dermatophagoides pteronyssinus TaxID=6956 RepID=A0ABQ8J9L5_DERPT|nr:hypothetical protein DERP_005809 [Dermatophagoides pteronyssinus]